MGTIETVSYDDWFCLCVETGQSMLMCLVLLFPWSVPIVQKILGIPIIFPPKESRVRLPVIFMGLRFGSYWLKSNYLQRASYMTHAGGNFLEESPETA